MRLFLCVLCSVTICGLAACTSSQREKSVSDEDKALAEEWADKIKEEEGTRPICSFNKAGVGGCHYD